LESRTKTRAANPAQSSGSHLDRLPEKSRITLQTRQSPGFFKPSIQVTEIRITQLQVTDADTRRAVRSMSHAAAVSRAVFHALRENCLEKRIVASMVELYQNEARVI
jgi:hypothetical protein